ncbi:helix-turn-helix domain-containing protein [Actinospica sp.]|jgi:transcriptional regulator with XRE-family HTH domain|uniref:helix-turn-helix domain-containing protein n=1 Tax=Actinospica sp. TaxID=1872142 RepID=UPI002CBEDD43|nr:helix-turn-helix domain-containing protein [Actinospica sp.]HWG25108.1 helix-turn-helix domain-containing protein [Actinospica sp.]
MAQQDGEDRVRGTQQGAGAGGGAAGTGHKEIGELLLQARLDRGLTAREVSELTRITPETLRRVEAGQFEHCGGDVYARGHIRAYARAVGVDPEPLLLRYGAVHLPPLTKRDLRKPRTANPSAPPRTDKPLGSARKDARQAATNRARAVLPTIVPGALPSLVPMVGASTPPDLPALKQPRREDYTDADSGSAARLVDPLVSDGAAVNEAPAAFLGGAKTAAARSGPNWSLALLGAIGAVGLVAAVQLWPHDAPATTAAAGAAGAAVPQAKAQHAAAPKAAAKPVTRPAPAVAPKAPVDLKISTKTEPVWVGVTDSAGRQLYWNILGPGTTKEFTDKSRLDVTLGNAAGVALLLNGKSVTSAGTDGQVVSTSFGPQGQL